MKNRDTSGRMANFSKFWYDLRKKKYHEFQLPDKEIVTSLLGNWCEYEYHL